MFEDNWYDDLSYILHKFVQVIKHLITWVFNHSNIIRK
jgi:hypothetical protein